VTLTTKEVKPNAIDPQQAATIASLWAKLTEEADSDNEAKVFLLMFGPWAHDKLQQTAKS
jgi:hypothetical protein